MTDSEFTTASKQAIVVLKQAGAEWDNLTQSERETLARISMDFDKAREKLYEQNNKDLIDIQLRFYRDCQDLAVDVQQRQQQGGAE